MLVSGLPANSEMMDSRRSRQQAFSYSTPTACHRTPVSTPPKKQSKPSKARTADRRDHLRRNNHSLTCLRSTNGAGENVSLFCSFPTSCRTYTALSPADHRGAGFRTSLLKLEHLFRCLTDASQSVSRPLPH